MELPRFDFEGTNRRALEHAAREHWEDLASACWKGYEEKGRGFYLINQQEGNERYTARRTIQGNFGHINMLDRFAQRKGVDTDLLMKQLREYDPEREIVLLLIPSFGAARRMVIGNRPEFADELLKQKEPEEKPVSGVFEGDPPPRSFGPPEREPASDFDPETLARGAELLEGALHALLGTGGDKDGAGGGDIADDSLVSTRDDMPYVPSEEFQQLSERAKWVCRELDLTESCEELDRSQSDSDLAKGLAKVLGDARRELENRVWPVWKRQVVNQFKKELDGATAITKL